MSPKLFEQFEFTPHTRVLVAVSGGVDSMVLLDLAVRAPNLDVVVATFDYYEYEQFALRQLNWLA